MTLDPRFICTSDLEGLFVDKNTGLPMAAGQIFFYSDFSRTIPKAVYQLTGSPPTGFIALPNPLTLNSIGSYQDNLGNEIVIYYLPFHQTIDGDISTTTTTPELYYISVFNSNGVLQFTRDDWPPLASNLFPSNVSGEGTRNYIPNGQFLSHNNNPIVDSASESGINITEIAQGGWSFKETTGGTGVYTITFNNESNTSLGALTDFPPYSVNIVSVGAGSETVRDLVIQWPDVSRFSLSTNTIYNFLFAATSNNLSSISVNVNLIMNFGTGGSSQITTPIGPQTIAASGTGYQYFNQTVTVPSTSGKTITSDSFIALAIRLPTGTPIDIRLTDFAFTLGNSTLASFPITTNAQTLSQGVAGWMPTPDPTGLDLYLPLILTNRGMIFDHSIVGEIVAKTQINALPNELPLNGSATYLSAGYNSATGIPYQRLMNYLLLNSAAITISGGALLPAHTVPLLGTGPQFVTLFNVSGFNAEFYIQMNTASASGTATGVSASITIAATSAFNYYTATVVTVPAASDYWTFTAPTSGLVYNVWYTLDGTGTAPATPTGANILVKLVTGDTTGTTAAKTIAAVNQYQFYLPNLQGLFLRGLDPSGIYDLDFAARTIPGIMFNSTFFAGGNLGSLELQAFLQHTHAANAGSAGQYFFTGTGGQTLGTSGAPTISTFEGSTTGNSALGGTETRPVNFAVNWYIKY